MVEVEAVEVEVEEEVQQGVEVVGGVGEVEVVVEEVGVACDRGKLCTTET